MIKQNKRGLHLNPSQIYNNLLSLDLSVGTDMKILYTLEFLGPWCGLMLESFGSVESLNGGIKTLPKKILPHPQFLPLWQMTSFETALSGRKTACGRERDTLGAEWEVQVIDLKVVSENANILGEDVKAANACTIDSRGC